MGPAHPLVSLFKPVALHPYNSDFLSHPKPAMLYRIPPDPTRFMDHHHHQQRFIGSDHCLLRLFSSQPESDNPNPQFELHEDDIFDTQISQIPDSPNPSNPQNPNFRRRIISGRNFGILAALPDRNPNLMPNLSISLSSSSAMMIPPSAKAKDDEKGKALRSSAPVTIPAVSAGRSFDFDLDGGGDEEMTAMTMPPHEMVARRSPMMMSVLEGVGRTLKGRDLRRVRNAILID